MATSSNNRNRSRISFTFDLGAVVAAIIALVGGLIVGVFGVRQLGQQGAPTIQVGETATTKLPTYTPYSSNPTYTPYPTHTPYPASPTYTPFPTYTPYPTFTPYLVVSTPGPLIVTPTPGAEEQNPPPGSIIPAGQPYTKGGITVVARKELEIGTKSISAKFEIHNGTSEQLLVRWKGSLIHLRDNTGRVYHQLYEDSAGYHEVFQFAMSPGSSRTIHGSHTYGLSSQTYAYFVGPIDPTVDYLVFTIDEIAGMSDLNWRYDLQ